MVTVKRRKECRGKNIRGKMDFDSLNRVYFFNSANRSQKWTSRLEVQKSGNKSGTRGSKIGTERPGNKTFLQEKSKVKNRRFLARNENCLSIT